MKIKYIIVLLAAAVGVANAQSLSDFTERIAVSEDSTVQINVDDKSTEALERVVTQSIDEKTGEPTPASVQGYRIGIYFDNSAKARAGAMAVVEKCDSLLSDLKSTMSYDNPYFKVSVGYCISQEEAVMMLHRVQKIFPRAYLMRERITPSDIVLERVEE